MALNPSAPDYFPSSSLLLLPELYSPPPPPPPPPPPTPPFQLYVELSPSGSAFFYSLTSCAPPSYPYCLYGTSPSKESTPQPWVTMAQPPLLLSSTSFDEQQGVWASPTVEEFEQEEVEVEEEEAEEVSVAKKKEGVVKGSRGYWRPKGFKVSNQDDLVPVRRAWIPKFRSRSRWLHLPFGDGFQFKDGEQEEEDAESRSTVMIRNLPNKLTKEQLLQMLDDHCCEENKKIIGEGGVEDGTSSEFDFLYLPMDFDSGNNLGYAFVNFTSAVAARRLHRAYHNKEWDQLLRSRKVREITYARIQGLAALQKRFRNSVFICDSEDFLPVYFTPSRNGERETEKHHIGKRISKASCARI